jgi:hypothetical protein
MALPRAAGAVAAGAPVAAEATPCVIRGRISSSASPPILSLLTLEVPRAPCTTLHSSSATPHPRKRPSLLPTGAPSRIHRGSLRS